jgi:hypothetical protein
MGVHDGPNFAGDSHKQCEYPRARPGKQACHWCREDRHQDRVCGASRECHGWGIRDAGCPGHAVPLLCWEVERSASGETRRAEEVLRLVPRPSGSPQIPETEANDDQARQQKPERLAASGKAGARRGVVCSSVHRVRAPARVLVSLFNMEAQMNAKESGRGGGCCRASRVDRRDCFRYSSPSHAPGRGWFTEIAARVATNIERRTWRAVGRKGGL